MNAARVLYVFTHSLTAPLPRLHGLGQVRELASRGRPFSVISFEPGSRSAAEQRDYERVRRGLTEAGIDHIPLKKLGSRWLEIPVGALAILWCVFSRGARTLHARSYVPAIMAGLVRLVTPTRLVFDMRGLFVDEYLLEGALRPGSAKLALARWLERRLLFISDSIVVVSERFRDHLLSSPLYAGSVPSSKITVVPNRVESARFDAAIDRRAETRRERGYEGKLVGVFAGAVSPWHRLDLTASVMARVMQGRPDVRFLVAVYPSREEALRILREQRVPSDRAEVLTASPDEIPTLFASCDFGLMLIDDDVSKQVCAPVKFGEYLAAGLPVVAGGGIGDACDWVEEKGLGILVGLSDVEESARLVLDFLRSERFVSGAMRDRVMRYARTRMDMSDTIDQYENIYRSLDPL